MKIISQLLIILYSGLLFGQDAEKTDLEIGDVAPTWALMYAPGKFEFLRNWSEVKIDEKLNNLFKSLKEINNNLITSEIENEEIYHSFGYHANGVNTAPWSGKELANLMVNLSGKSLEIKFDKLPEGDIKESQADVSLAKKMINWSYETTLEDGLENFFFS